MSIDCVNLLKGNTARMTAMFVFWAFFGGHQDSEQLASGSFGVVFLAKDKKTNQQALPPSENALAKAKIWSKDG